MSTLIRNFTRDQSGATAIEYGVIASLIGVVIIAALRVTGSRMSGTFSKVASNLS